MSCMCTCPSTTYNLSHHHNPTSIAMLCFCKQSGQLMLGKFSFGPQINKMQGRMCVGLSRVLPCRWTATLTLKGKKAQIKCKLNPRGQGLQPQPAHRFLFSLFELAEAASSSSSKTGLEVASPAHLFVLLWLASRYMPRRCLPIQ